MATWKYKVVTFDKSVDAGNQVSVTFDILKDDVTFLANTTVKGHPDYIKNIIEDIVKRKALAYSSAQTVLNVNDVILVTTTP